MTDPIHPESRAREQSEQAGRAHIAELQQQLEAAEARIAELQERLTAAEAERDEARNIAASLAGEMDEAETRVDTLAEVVRRESGRREAVERELAALRTQLGDA
jgi:chromosome segregation protein